MSSICQHLFTLGVEMDFTRNGDFTWRVVRLWRICGVHFIPLNLLVHYSDNPHKLEYVVDDGAIIINNVSDGNEWKNYTLPSKYI